MCILLTLNAAYCPLEHMEVICVKFTEMGVIWLFFPRGFVYVQIVKKVAGQQGLSFWVFRGPRQVMISVKVQ